MLVRIAVVQPKIVAQNVKANLRGTGRLLSSLKGKADIVLFPEQFLTGPVGKNTGILKSEALYLKELREIAKENRLDIAFGLIVKGARGALNRAYYVDRNGKLLASYTKSNLWRSERQQVKSGKGTSVFKTRFGKVSLIICWDIMDGEIFKEISAKKAEIVLCPSLWWKGSNSVGTKHDADFATKFVDAMCMARAYGNNAVVAFSNAAGTIRFEDFSDLSIGNSQVVVPFAGVLARMRGNKEGIAIATVDTDILSEARRYFEG